MALQAVGFVVLQKFVETMGKEPVIHYNLDEIKGTLTKTGGFETEDGQGTDQTPHKYLEIVYGMEDVIETFSVRMACRRKRLGFLINNRCFCLINCTASRKFHKKMAREISKLNDARRSTELGDQEQEEYRDEVKALLKDGFTSGVVGKLNDARRSTELCDQGQEEEYRDEVKALPKDGFTSGVVGKLNDARRSTELGDQGQEEEYRDEVKALPKDDFTSGVVGKLNDARRSTELGDQGQEEEYRDEVKALPKDDFTSGVDDKVRSLSLSDRLRQIRKFNNSFEEYKKTWVDRLLNNEGDLVFSVVGKMGSGKTTLVREVYEERRIKDYFDCHAWVFVFKEYTIIDLLLSLLKQVGNFKEQEADEKELGKRLLDHLKEKRYLVVLDDVTTIDVWNILKLYLPDTGNGSKIIFTTSAADVVEGSQRYDMRPLSDIASWDMFLEKACRIETTQTRDSIPEDLKQNILFKCAGLPLNIVLLSGLLSTDERRNGEVREDEWTGLLSSQENWQTSDILFLCYKDLPVYSKLCLLYMALFPKGFDIPVRRLLRLWLAEGFVKLPSDQMKFPEDVVQGYFDDLVSRKMIVISKWRSDDTARSCRLLGAVHDYLLPKAWSIKLFYVHRNLVDVPIGIIRRIVDHADIKNLDPRHPFQTLRSYISFNFRKKDTPAKEVGTFLGQIIGNGFGLLRVLDLEGVYKPTLPDKLGELYNLRYLGLRWTFLDTIPQSVGDLVYLETLDVKHTRINSLPNSIWKLKYLRNLNLNENRLDMPLKQWQQETCVSELTLLTLWGLFVNHKSPVKNGLDRLSHLRELGISFDLPSGQEDLFQWIQGLKDVRTLRLRCRDDNGRPSILILKPLSELVKLCNLNLLGNIGTLPDQCFPPNVKVLTLSVSRLLEDPMPTLAQLSSLTVLRLLADSYVGSGMRCSEGTFCKLRVLKLWMLRELEKWDVEKGEMENLKELNIRCCRKLNNISPTLLEHEKLKEITLVDMPQEFRDKIQLTKKDHTFLTVNTEWKFTPLPESFL